LKSRHTLLVKGLNNCMIRKTKCAKEIFESFGEVDHVMNHSNDTCFVRMKRSLDATKVVMLFKNNNVSDAVKIDFAPYYHEAVARHEMPPRLDKKSHSLPMNMSKQLQQASSPRNGHGNGMQSSMTPRNLHMNQSQSCRAHHAAAYNQYSEYIKYQYQCYALWHQQQCQQYYAAAMMHAQQQSSPRNVDYAQFSNAVSVGNGSPNGMSSGGYSIQGLRMKQQVMMIPEPTLNYPMSPNLATM